MEEDSLAFTIFGGFVALSTIATWAVVTFFLKERTYENAKSKVKPEDLSWMDTPALRAAKQAKREAKSRKQLQQKPTKSAEVPAPPPAEELTADDDSDVPTMPMLVKPVKQSKTESAVMSSASPASTDNSPKPKALKKKNKPKPATVDSIPTKPADSNRQLSLNLDDEEGWTSVGVKSSSGKSAGSTPAINQLSHSQPDVIPPAARQQVPKPSPSLSQASPASSLTTTENEDSPRILSGSRSTSKSAGDGANLDDEILGVPSGFEVVTKKNKAAGAGKAPEKPKPAAAAAPAAPSAVQTPKTPQSPPQAARKTPGAGRVKRASERTSESASSAKKVEVTGDPVKLAKEILELQDELKKEREHSHDLRGKFLQLSSQAQRDKEAKDALTQSLQAAVQKLSQTKGEAAVQMATSASGVAERRVEELQAENKRILAELKTAKNSALEGKQDFQKKLQIAENQLRMIETRNKELEAQSKRYESQLKSASVAPPKSPDLLPQLKAQEEKSRQLEAELVSLRKKAESDLSELSRLNETNVALQKQLASLSEASQSEKPLMNGSASNGSTDEIDKLKSSEAVESSFKNAIIKIYPELSTSYNSEYATFLSLFEKHANVTRGSSDSELSKLTQQISQLQEEKADLVRRNDRYKVTLSETEESVAKLDNAFSTLEAEYKERVAELTEENNLLRRDTEKVVDLQLQLDQLKADQSKNNEQAVSSEELQSKLSQLTQELEEARCKAVSDSEKVASLEQSLKDFDQIKQQANDELDKMRNELSIAREGGNSEMQQLQARISSLEQEVRDSQKNAEEKQHKIDDLNSQLSTIEAAKAELSGKAYQVESLAGQLSEKENIIQNLTKESSDAKSEVESLKSKISELEAASAAKAQEGDQLRKSSEDLSNAKASLEAEIGALKDSLAKSSAESSEKQSRIDALEAELDSTKKSLVESGSSSQQKECEIVQLTESSAKLEQSRNDLEAEKNRIVSEKDSLQSQLNDLQQKLAQSAEAENTIKDLNNQLSGKQAELDALSSKVSEAEGNLSSKQEALANIEREKGAVEEQLKEKVSAVNSLNEQLATAQKQVDQEREAAGKQVEDLKAQLESLTQEHKLEKEKMTGEMNELLSKVKDLESRRASIEAGGTTDKSDTNSIDSSTAEKEKKSSGD